MVIYNELCKMIERFRDQSLEISGRSKNQEEKQYLTQLSNTLDEMLKQAQSYALTYSYEEIKKFLTQAIHDLKYYNFTPKIDLINDIKDSLDYLKQKEQEVANNDIETASKEQKTVLCIRQRCCGNKLTAYKEKLASSEGAAKNQQLHLIIFNLEVILAGYQQMKDYKGYLKCNIEKILKGINECLKDCSSSDDKIMFEKLCTQLEELIAYSKGEIICYTDLIQRIDAIRRQMHQEYPLPTLIYNGYNSIYNELLAIANQLITEQQYTMEQSSGIIIDTIPLLYLNEIFIDPSEFYYYFMNELSLIIEGLNYEYQHSNSINKNKLEKVINDFIEIKRLAVIDSYYDLTYKLKKASDNASSISSMVGTSTMKGIVNNIQEFEEKLRTIEKINANRYIRKNRGQLSAAQALSLSFNTLKNQISVQEEKANDLDHQLWDNFENLSDNEKITKMSELNNNFSQIMYHQMLFKVIASRAYLAGTELSPGEVKKLARPRTD